MSSPEGRCIGGPDDGGPYGCTDGSMLKVIDGFVSEPYKLRDELFIAGSPAAVISELHIRVRGVLTQAMPDYPLNRAQPSFQHNYRHCVDSKLVFEYKNIGEDGSKISVTKVLFRPDGIFPTRMEEVFDIYEKGSLFHGIYPNNPDCGVPEIVSSFVPSAAEPFGSESRRSLGNLRQLLIPFLNGKAPYAVGKKL